MSRRIMTDAETMVIGLAYPTSPQGQIVTAWRHGALEIVLGRDSLEALAYILCRMAGQLGWSLLTVSEMVSAIRLKAMEAPPGITYEPPSKPGQEGGLPMGASFFITEDEEYLALAETHPVVTPERFWETYG